MNTITVI